MEETFQRTYQNSQAVNNPFVKQNKIVLRYWSTNVPSSFHLPGSSFSLSEQCRYIVNFDSVHLQRNVCGRGRGSTQAIRRTPCTRSRCARCTCCSASRCWLCPSTWYKRRCARTWRRSLRAWASSSLKTSPTPTVNIRPLRLPLWVIKGIWPVTGIYFNY